MANGSHKSGPAQADRYREKYRARGRSLQAKLDAVARELPQYRDEMDSASELTAPGVTAKMPLPRKARLAIGYALAVVLVATGIGGVIVAVAKLL